jgi:hypothetical protein
MVQRLLLVHVVLPRVLAVVVTDCAVIVLPTLDPVVAIGRAVVVMAELELAVTIEGVVALTPYSAA